LRVFPNDGSRVASRPIRDQTYDLDQGTMKPIDHFQFCPQCGRRQTAPASPITGTETAFRCPECAFTYYFNPAIAAGVFIANPNGEVLFIRRARDPAKGRLAVPGGFIDVGETAEAGLRRETREEVNLDLGPMEYLCSQPNEYLYKGVSYPVLDLFFTAQVPGGGAIKALDGVQSCHWFKPAEVNLEELAFPSIRAAWRVFLEKVLP
jgi:NAD+ diphosphatase